MKESIVIAQIAVILVAARGMGWFFRRIGQPAVVGEMAAGIVLGPSLLGWLAPGLAASLFPPDSLEVLSALSQIGVLVFMFLVGLEVDADYLRRRSRAIFAVSQTSIVVPFALGALLAAAIHGSVGVPGVPLGHFMLFLGTAMSVTAFPVLARILADQNMVNTPVGSMAIACAAVADVAAWSLLAALLILVNAASGALPLWLALARPVLFVIATLVLGRFLLDRIVRTLHRRGTGFQNVIAVILVFVLAAAWVADQLGMHALFGAFLVGAVVPRANGLAHELSSRLETVTVVLLLPLFFAFTGLRTSVFLLGEPGIAVVCLVIVAVAILGKVGGAAIGARAVGMGWREAAAVGVLLNTRGLMELVLVNIGYDIGIISAELFTALVVMALMTTFLTAPLLHAVLPARRAAASASPPIQPAIGD